MASLNTQVTLDVSITVTDEPAAYDKMQQSFDRLEDKMDRLFDRLEMLVLLYALHADTR
jgi:hypothetical protein